MCKTDMTSTVERKRILVECLAQCEARLEKDRNNRPLIIIREVIESLLDYVQGNSNSPDDLVNNDKIGLFSVREFESHDIEFASYIYRVVDINNEIKKELAGL